MDSSTFFGCHDPARSCWSMDFSVDLVSSARALVTFLRKVHVAEQNALGQLYRESPEFLRAVAEYKVWMGSAAQFGATHAPPPSLEVAWIWLLHRLDPQDYADDCHAFAGHLIDCNSSDPFAYIDNAPCATGASDNLAMDTISVDLAACAERQGGFLWQVRWAEYTTHDFLCDALERYGKLVGLWATTMNTFLVPTYDIDLMWHAHMASPIAYADDCMRLIGRLIGHDDSVNDRGKGSKLCNGASLTAELWAAHYPGTMWHTPGGMWRGEPPRWYYEQPFLAVQVGATLSPPSNSWVWWRSPPSSPPPSPPTSTAADELEIAVPTPTPAKRSPSSKALTELSMRELSEKSLQSTVGLASRAVVGVATSPARIVRAASGTLRPAARPAASTEQVESRCKLSKKCEERMDGALSALCIWLCCALMMCIMCAPYIAALIGYFKATEFASQLSDTPPTGNWTTVTERCVNSFYVSGVLYTSMHFVLFGVVSVAVLVVHLRCPSQLGDEEEAMALVAGPIMVFYVVAAFAGSLVVQYQMPAWGQLPTDNQPNPYVLTGWDELTVDGMIGQIREYSDPVVFLELNPHHGHHCHELPETASHYADECHHHENWPWVDGIVLPYHRQVIDYFTAFNLSFAPADTLPLMQVRCCSSKAHQTVRAYVLHH